MGKRIEEELRINNEIDTLGRWMAHYIAELKLDAETEKDKSKKAKAKKECASFILKLWKHRECMPRHIRPLGKVEKILEGICALQEEPQSWKRVVSDEKWVKFADRAQLISKNIVSVAVLMAIAETQFSSTKRWLDENSDALSRDETKIIESLDAWLKTDVKWDAKRDEKSISAMPPKERMKKTHAEIERQLSKMRDAFTELKSARG